MSRVVRIGRITIPAIAIAVFLLERRATPAVPVLAIAHVTIVDVSGGPSMPDQTVVIEGGRIATLGTAETARVPAGARVIEGAGRFLIPGLWDMHVHAVSYEQAVEAIPAVLSKGITGLRDMGAPLNDALRLRIESRESDARAPHLIVSGPLLVPPLPPKLAAMTLLRVIDDPSHAGPIVQSLNNAGVDFIKVSSSLSRDTYFAVAREAAQRRIPFVGHVPPAVSAAEASDAGQRSIEHLGGPHHAVLVGCSTRETELQQRLVAIETQQIAAVFADREPDPGELRAAVTQPLLDSFSDERMATLLARFRRNGTWHTPTLGAIRGLWDRKDLQPDDLEYGSKIRQKQLAIVLAMQRAGVKLLAGTDGPWANAGAKLHDELALLVQAGLSPSEAIWTATLGPAEFIGRAGDLGTVTPGKIADLVLLDADPLSDIHNTTRINTVILGGQVVTPLAH
jgi:imidazolonepropionase-like amidohydrolase